MMNFGGNLIACVDMEFNIARGSRVDSKEIVEIGVVVIDNFKRELLSFSSKVCPSSGRLSEETCRFLCVDRSEIMSAPSIQDVLTELDNRIDEFLPRIRYWASWGNLDSTVINHFRRKLNLKTRLFSEIKYLDAQDSLARKVPSAYPRMGLVDAVYDYGYGWSGCQHNALDDARNMADIASFWRV